MYVIIGQGAAGTAAAFRLRELAPDCEITILTEETDWFYSRILLTDLAGGRCEESAVTLQPENVFAEKNIQCRMGVVVKALLPDEKCVLLEDNSKIPYEKLLLATGARPVLPTLPGSSAKGLGTLWTLEDAREVQRQAQPGRRIAVVGGGFIGLKLALALRNKAEVFISAGRRRRLMPDQLDEFASSLLKEHLESLGIPVLTAGGVDAFTEEGGHITGLVTGGETHACDFAVIAAGTRPSTALAADAGLDVGKGIIVNSQLETSVSGIYAAGDAAEVKNVFGETVVSATWPSAVALGRLAAENMFGLRRDYLPYLNMNSVELDHMTIISAGRIQEMEGDQVMQRHDDGGIYRKAVFRDGRMAGILLMGQPDGAGILINRLQRQLETDCFDPDPDVIYRQLFLNL